MMMDKKQIIEDGILEQYILGELHPKDEVYIEQLLATDNELRQEYDALEAIFEQIGMDNASVPSPEVKRNLTSQIQQQNLAQNPSYALPKPNHFKMYFGFAASFAAFLLVGSLWLSSQLNTLKNDLRVVEANNKNLQQEADALKNNFNQSNKLLAVLSHPDTKQYVLEGNALMPNGKAVSYVNHDTKSVIVNTERLPKLDADHNYQMWADVEGEMINMGIIDLSQSLLALNYINNSESLNITIEPLGGSEHPTVERLVTNIYL